MKNITNILTKGTHIVVVPSAEKISLEALFPKELAGSTIEMLDENGNWVYKETIFYENNAFKVSKNYTYLKPLQVLRLSLKRIIKINWSIDFQSYSGLKKIDFTFKEGFEFEEALYLAQLANLIYQKKEEIQDKLDKNYSFDSFSYYSIQSHKHLLKQGIVKILSIFLKSKIPLVDLQFMYLSKKDKKTEINTLIIVFRGSQEVQDWMTNLNLQSDDFKGRGKVHSGFLQTLKLFIKTAKKRKINDINAQHSILEEIKNMDNTKIILTGHSLGGALATLSGCFLLEAGIKKENLEIYTFGAPPIGSKEFVDYYDNKISIFRLVNENDVVPKLDKVTTLHHIGKAIILPSNEGEIHACEGYIDNIIDQIEMEGK